MHSMAKLRNIFAVLVLASYPPAILLWVAIHPFASFWRKLGPVWTYVLLGIPVAAYMVGVWLVRDALLGTDLGTSVITMILAAMSFAAGALLNHQRRKHLNFVALSGIPELSQAQYPGKLFTDGIYGRIRNPRYVEVNFFTLSYALFANYLGTYLVVLLGVPLIYLVVVLEERELQERFGEAYEEYCRHVPRFLPWRRA
jgi:protein-S-isoprenylcysteine O-methyltransferase Ste14